MEEESVVRYQISESESESEDRLYTERELVSFGNYLLSDSRYESIRGSEFSAVSDEMMEKLSGVHDADLANWKEEERQESESLPTGQASLGVGKMERVNYF